MQQVPCCSWCQLTINLRKCGRCNRVHYCSKDHQVLDWKRHKRQCKNESTAGLIEATVDKNEASVNSTTAGFSAFLQSECSANVSNTSVSVSLFSEARESQYIGTNNSHSANVSSNAVYGTDSVQLQLSMFLQTNQELDTFNLSDELSVGNIYSSNINSPTKLYGTGVNQPEETFRTDKNSAADTYGLNTNSPTEIYIVNKSTSPEMYDVNLLPEGTNVNLPTETFSTNKNPSAETYSFNTNLPTEIYSVNTNTSPEMYSTNVNTSPEAYSTNINLPPETFSTNGILSADDALQIDSLAGILNEACHSDTLFSANLCNIDPLYDRSGFNLLNSEQLSTTNNYWDIINSYDPANVSLDHHLNAIPENTIVDDRIITESFVDDFSFSRRSLSSPISCQPSIKETVTDHVIPLSDICINIVHDLNEYGICVIDGFLGSKSADLIAAEVKAMCYQNVFKKGRLASDTSGGNQNVRGDVITWVNGTESGCVHIGSLIRKLDVVMTACNKMADNGILCKYRLQKRTKAMIACYPGNGTHYKKHVDNPHGDGRCITCIYYLNKKWDSKVHGGLLRMFPVGHEEEVANIEPVFDRMLFFWSDRRNPHEVLPSYAIRFAITVWYFDSDEREHALKKNKK